MSTLTANRENAQLSTGPVTPEGKARVRLNALNHGLTGDTILMPYEDAARYQAFVDSIVATLRPVGAAEQSLAQSIADGHWRLNRARTIEGNIFALGYQKADGQNPEAHPALTQAQTYLDHARQFQLLTLYEGRIDRAIRRNQAELKEVQTARRAAEAQALAEATLLAQLAESKGEPFDPAANGFEFSRDLLDRRIAGQRRLAEARAHAQSPLKRAA